MITNLKCIAGDFRILLAKRHLKSHVLIDLVAFQVTGDDVGLHPVKLADGRTV